MVVSDNSFIFACVNHALVVELVDTPDLGSGAARRVSSSLIRRTKRKAPSMSQLFIGQQTEGANRLFINLFHAAFNKRLHLGPVLLDAQQEVQLVVGADEVVVGILALPVLVAAEVVPEEADALHVGEEGSGVG